jgi:hypothetical protein
MRLVAPRGLPRLALSAAAAVLVCGCGGGASHSGTDLGAVPFVDGATVVEQTQDCSQTNSLVAYFKNSPCVTSAVAGAAGPLAERTLLADESAALLGHGWLLLGRHDDPHLPDAVERLIDDQGKQCLMIGDPGAVWKYEGVVPGDLSPVPTFWLDLVRSVHRAAAAGDAVLYLELRSPAAVAGGSPGC